MEFLYPINGLFFYKLIFMAVLLLGEGMFVFKLEKRNHFWLKAVISILSCLLLALAFPIPTGNEFYSMMMFFVLFAFTYGFSFLLFKADWRMLLFCLICGYTTEHIAYEVYSTLSSFIISGDSKPGGLYDYNSINMFDGPLDFCLWIISYINIYWIIFICFARRIVKGQVFRSNDGLKVLLMADSTSRWAQALREMSNRLEELPGPDAFPMDLSAIIANFYARAGFVHLKNGATGSVTFIGTVSPAGGNLKEPVTENTKKVARCFYALEQERADRKRYPAVNPIESYSKYLEYPEFQEYIAEHISPDWIEKVNEIKTRMLRGKEIAEQINILGDDGVPVDYHVIFWKSELIDFVILQQDAFDPVDSVTSLPRQEFMLNKVIDICRAEFAFDNFLSVMDYFKRVINVFKQMNYSEFESEQFRKFNEELDELLRERIVK